MRSKRIQKRSQKALPIMWAAFACADVIDEAMRRVLGGSVEPTSSPVFVSIGRAIQKLRQALLAADAHYQSLRARQRRRQRRRDRIAKRLYGELRDFRRLLKSRLGLDAASQLIVDIGPTERDPYPLFYQAQDVARRLSQRQHSPDSPSRQRVIKAVASTLDASVKELDAALEAVIVGRAETMAAMFDQRQAMKDFDRVCNEGGRILEDQLRLAGLPTLGDAVRPGVGRRGRPLKHRPVDRYPDLVRQVIETNLMTLPPDQGNVENNPSTLSDGLTGHVTQPGEVEGETEALVTTSATAEDRAEPVERNSECLENGSEGEKIIAQPLHNRSEGEEIIEQPLHNRSEGEEIIAQPFHNRSESEEIIEQPLHNRSEGEEKIEQPFHNLLEDHLNAVDKGLELPVSRHSCDRQLLRPSAELRRLRRSATRRSEPSSGLRSPESPGSKPSFGGSVRRATTAFWQRLRSKSETKVESKTARTTRGIW